MPAIIKRTPGTNPTKKDEIKITIADKINNMPANVDLAFFFKLNNAISTKINEIIELHNNIPAAFCNESMIEAAFVSL